MKVYLNNGHPMRSLNGYALEIEQFACLIDSMCTLVQPKSLHMENGMVSGAPDADTIESSFLGISTGLRRIADEMMLQFEIQVQEEKEPDKMRLSCGSHRFSNRDFMNIPENIDN